MLVMSMLLLLTGCSGEKEDVGGVAKAVIGDMAADVAANAEIPKMTGQIYLYGEAHGHELILEKEYELWEDYYNNHGMRHLFIERSYFSAELLNVWMQEDSDEILDEIFYDISGALGGTSYDKDFYKRIKENCPETVFHGTDVGHQYNTTGPRYLKYLRDTGLEDSEQFKIARENMEQARTYYARDKERKISANVFRETKMVENFVREYEALEDEDIMGIYGAAHTSLDSLNYSGEVDCMGTQLYEKYGDKVHSEDLQKWAQNKSIRTETMVICDKEYDALYFGEIRYKGQKIRFWRIEDAYEDFKDCQATGNINDYSFYPMNIEPGQVFVIDYEASDGTITRTYHYDRGLQLEGWNVTEEFTLE